MCDYLATFWIFVTRVTRQGVTSGTATAYPSREPAFTPGF